MPRNATFDVPFTIDASGLPRDQTAEVDVAGTASGGIVWQGGVTARTDRQGRIDLRDEYLYPHMHTAGGQLSGWPRHLTITVRAGRASASTTASRSPLAVSNLTVTDERPQSVGFYGEWITPRGVRHHTAILMFGGSEGGMNNGTLAETLAAHGYPVLQIAYFAEPGLPTALRRIPLEYFERALIWLARQPQVDPQRVVTWGWSRGGEASLLLASTFPQLVDAAVGYVPSAFVFDAPADRNVPAWTLHGRPLAPLTVIPVWKSRGPLFVVGGDDDGLWPSGAYVAQIAKEMHDHGRHDVTALAYPGAGHMLFLAVPPQTEQSPVGYGEMMTNYGLLDLGGSPHADEVALERSWPQALRFLASI